MQFNPAVRMQEVRIHRIGSEPVVENIKLEQEMRALGRSTDGPNTFCLTVISEVRALGAKLLSLKPVQFGSSLSGRQAGLTEKWAAVNFVALWLRTLPGLFSRTRGPASTR